MKKTKTPLSIAVGTAFAATAVLTPLAQAADNPFGQQKLEAGYQLAQADTKGKEGKCGGDKKADGKCGGEKKMDGKCGGDKKTEGKCGGDAKADKKMDGKCGGDKKTEGKCGGKK